MAFTPEKPKNMGEKVMKPELKSVEKFKEAPEITSAEQAAINDAAAKELEAARKAVEHSSNQEKVEGIVDGIFRALKMDSKLEQEEAIKRFERVANGRQDNDSERLRAIHYPLTDKDFGELAKILQEKFEQLSKK